MLNSETQSPKGWDIVDTSTEVTRSRRVQSLAFYAALALILLAAFLPIIVFGC